MVWSNIEKITVVGGVAAIGLLGAYAILNDKGGNGAPDQDKYLLISFVGTGGGGAINPISSTGLEEPKGTVVTLTATPETGYAVGSWVIDGNEQSYQGTQMTVTMNTNHTVFVNFWVIDPSTGKPKPPVSSPTGISSTSSVTAYGFYGCKVTLGSFNDIQSIAVHNCDQNWTWDNWAQYPVSFRVTDATGRGVPNVPVDIWPDVTFDSGNEVGLLGFTAIGLQRDSPVQVRTDANGYATTTVTYINYNQDHLAKLCLAAQLYVNTLTAGSVPVYDGSFAGGGTGPIFVNKGGAGKTPYSPTTMGTWAFNTIRAKVSGTGMQEAQCLLYNGYQVKML